MGKIFKILIGLVVLAGIGVGVVYGYKYYIDITQPDPVVVMPKDVTALFVVDHSNSTQIANLEKVLNKFPTDDPGIKYLIAQYDKRQTAGDQFSYEKIKESLKGDWKIAVGFKLAGDKTISKEEAENSSGLGKLYYAAVIGPNAVPGNVSDSLKADGLDGSADSPVAPASTSKGRVSEPDIYISGYFSNADEIEKLFVPELGKDFDAMEKDGVKLWTNEADDVYIIRDGKIFALTNSSKVRDEIVARLDKKDGFTSEDSYKNAKKDISNVLAYSYINIKSVKDILGSAIADFSDVYSFVSTDGEGLSMQSKTSLASKDSALVKNMIGAEKPSIIDKINADGIIAYYESPSAMTVLQSFEIALAKSKNSYSSKSKIVTTDTFIEALAKTLKVDKDDINALANSRFAFAVTNRGKLYPTFTLYLKLDDKNKDAAQKVVDAVDKYMDEMVAKLQGDIADTGDEKSNFIAATIKSSCVIFKAKNTFDPKLTAQTEAIFAEYGFDIGDNKKMKEISNKYSKDSTVTKAIADGIKAECGSVIPGSTSANPPTIKLQALISPSGTSSISTATPNPTISPMSWFFLKKGKVDTNGMDLTKWYIDWSLFPADRLEDVETYLKQLNVTDGTKALNFALYYGFPEENMLVFAIDPNLESSYGKTPLSADPLYLEAGKKIGGESWSSVSYFRPENMFTIADVYILLAKKTPMLTSAVQEAYITAKGIVSTFKYFIGMQKVEGDTMFSNGYTKVEKYQAAVADTKASGADTVKEDTVDAPSGPVDVELNVGDDAAADDTTQPVDKTATDGTEPRVKRVK